MKRILSALLALMLTSPVAFASVGLNINGTDVGAVGDLNIKNTSSAATTWSDGFTLSIPVLDPNLFSVGTGSAGSVSQVSSTAALSSTATVVRKVLDSNGDAAFTAGTLANGKPGQILTVIAAGASPSGASSGHNYTITPTTKTGFTSVKLSAINDMVTFLYVDDTTGWVITSYSPGASSSITITR